MRWLPACGVVMLMGIVDAAPAKGQVLSSTPTFKADTTAIVVDVIVRDRKGQPVTDLTLDDFELRENGIGQVVRAMTLVAPDAAITRKKGKAPDPPTMPVTSSSGDGLAPPGNTVVALVFDRLSPEARAMAHAAARTYAERPTRPDDLVGVFQVDLSLHTLQTYTNDRERVRAAIEAAAGTATSSFGRDASVVRSPSAGDRSPETSYTAGAESPGRASTPTAPSDSFNSGTGAAQAAMNELVGRMEDAYQLMAQEQEGMASTVALRALVTSLGVLPGRKTIVYFAEGLSLPESVIQRFDSLVELANQRNVAIYTVDAAGLRVQSGQAAAARGLEASGSEILDTSSNPAGISIDPRGRALTGIRSDPHAALGRLAEQTGGFLVDNTNNLAGGVERIESDRRFHYLLSYVPADAQFNGEYRRISVTLPRRPGLTVRSRTGYTAVREPGTFPTLSYEAAPLAVLARTPAPTDVPITARVLRLPDPAHPGRVALLVRVPGGAVRYDVPTGGTAYRADFTILARIKDEKGEVVRKASQPYHLTGAATEVEAARRGDIVFFRSPELPPGRYTVEYVVYDALADRAGVGSAPLDLPPPSPSALRVSDLVIVHRGETADDRTAPTNPLRLGDVLLYPNLGEPIVGGRDRALTLYFSVLPAASRQPLRATLSIARARQTLAEVPLSLEPPGPDGRIAMLTRIGIGALTPGEYAVVLSIGDGASTQVRSARFSIVADNGPSENPVNP